MTTSIARVGLLIAALFIAGCNETLEDIAPNAEAPLPPAVLASLQAKGMSKSAPIMVRIFKEEGELEIWKQKDNGRYGLATTYDICKWSGELGPKFTEGDRQAPEGFYTVSPWQMNPKSSYHLSFNIGYPNAYDRAHGRSGAHLMVHGACSSAGCYSMTDQQVQEIYSFARDAFRGGQTEFQVQAFPFRMTAANMARYRDDPNYGFWSMLKEGYDHFEITKVPPKVDVCEKRYVFNQMPASGEKFSAASACPIATQPEALSTAYQTYKASYETAFSAALNSTSKAAPAPSIAGFKEASLVADWSRRRSRGEKVTRLPPTLEKPEILIAEKPAPQKLEQTVAAVPTPAPQAQQAAATPAAPQTQQSVATTSDAAVAAYMPAAQASQEKPKSGLGLRRRILNLFGD